MGGSGCTHCGSLFHTRRRCGALRPASPIAPKRTGRKPTRKPNELHSKVSPYQYTKKFRSGEVRTVGPTPLYTLEEAERILAVQIPKGTWRKHNPKTWGTKLLPSGFTNRSWI